MSILDCLLSDELDSFMYQTVGHMGIEMLAEAMELPLFRKTTSGLTTQKGKNYEPTADDEVEDLFELLKQVKVGSCKIHIHLHFPHSISNFRTQFKLTQCQSVQSSPIISVFDVRMCELDRNSLH